MTGDIKTHYKSFYTLFTPPTAACFFKQVKQKINQQKHMENGEKLHVPTSPRPRGTFLVLHATTIGFPSIMQCSSEAVDP